jgi:hypothetical protein
MKADRSLVEARVRELFRRLPLLVGFSLDAELSLADVELESCPGCQWSDEVYSTLDDEISALVAELEQNEAAELLRGRTFARMLH